MKKSLGFYYAFASAALAAVALIVFFVYTGNGGEANTTVIAATIAAIVCEALLLTGEKAYSDYVGIIGAVLLAVAMSYSVIGGLGNMADQYQGIVMFGKAELANLNYAMFGIYMVSIVAAIGACFSKKSK